MHISSMHVTKPYIEHNNETEWNSKALETILIIIN